MKIKASIVAPTLLAMTLALVVIAAEQPAELDTEVKQFSYALGMDIGTSLKTSGIEVDAPVLTRAIQDVVGGKETLLTAAKALEVKRAVLQKVQAQQAAEAKALGEKNRAEGDTFLTQNKTKDGVKTTASGLQYQVIKQGDGPKPKDTDKVTVNYKGTLLDGTEFDSSYKRNQPATFGVKDVIPGWTEALQLMPVGSTFKLFLPPNLAYGERGAGGGKIGPNAVLIFDVELLSIDK